LENLKGRDHSEDLGVDDIRKDLRERVEGVDWIHLAQDRDHWLALVNMSLWVP
jgi:hypothetical protein